jgi:Na+/H+-dicarboxylate symporter
MSNHTTHSPRLALHWQILIAMALGVGAGLVSGADGAIAGIDVAGFFDLLGKLFMNALKMVVVPLILSSVISGVASLGASQDLGRIGGKTVLFYVLTTFFAVLVALIISNIIRPGVLDGEPVGERLALQTNVADVAEKVEARAHVGIGETLLTAVPENIVQAAAGTKLLGLVVFSVLFGYFLARIEPGRSKVLLDFWQAVFDVMLKITEFVMRFAPIGVFGLVAKTVAKTGFGAAKPLLVFSGSVLLSLVIYGVLLLPLLIRVFGRVSPWRIFPAMAPALLTAFSTASSSATLPMSLDCVERRAGVSNRICGFVLPLGASINHAGSALYECAAAMFIAQAYGLHLTFAHQFTIVVLALITSMGIAGIPAASLVAITIILTSIGLPAEAIGVLLVFDRLLDMSRTTINVLADGTCAVIVARMEGEEVLRA